MKTAFFRRGFTLVELLIVVAILSILVLVTAISINVPKRLTDANDLRRRQDIEKILQAVHLYIIDNKGGIPSGLSDTEQQIGTSVSGCVNLNRGCGVVQNACYDLGSLLPDYFNSPPFDPSKGSNSKTYYSIVMNSKKIITVRACGAEGTDEISVSM